MVNMHDDKLLSNLIQLYDKENFEKNNNNNDKNNDNNIPVDDVFQDFDED
jgi:hypothetical protein